MKTNNTIPLTISKDLLIRRKEHSEDILYEIVSKDFHNLILMGKSCDLGAIKASILELRPDLKIIDLYFPPNEGVSLFEQKLVDYLVKDFNGVVMITCENFKKDVMRISSAEDFEKLELSQKVRESMISLFSKSLVSSDEKLPMDIDTNRLFDRSHEEKLVLKTNEMIHAIKIKNIITAKADSNYTNFYLTDHSELLITQGLNTFEKKLASFGFLRTHQSYLVNLIHIKAFMKKTGQLILSNDIKTPVSKNRKTELLDYLNNL